MLCTLLLLIWILISLYLTLPYLFVQNCGEYKFPLLWHDMSIQAKFALHWSEETLGQVGRTQKLTEKERVKMIRNEKTVLELKIEREKKSRTFGFDYLMFGILNEKTSWSDWVPHAPLKPHVACWRLGGNRIRSHPRFSLCPSSSSSQQYA